MTKSSDYEDNLGRIRADRVVERIKHLMQSQGLTQRRLAKVSGVSESTISRILDGSRFPYSSTSAKIAKGLRVSIDYLMYGQDENTKSKIEPDIITFYQDIYPQLDSEDKMVLQTLVSSYTTRILRKKQQGDKNEGLSG